jgi:SSS family solute:Na+ symporter
MFWQRTSSAGALAAALGSAVLSVMIKLLWPELPFIDRVGLVFLLCAAVAVIVSLGWPSKTPSGTVRTDGVDFGTSAGFNVAAVAITLILVALYATWW